MACRSAGTVARPPRHRLKGATEMKRESTLVALPSTETSATTPVRTVGVEEELMLVDSATLSPTPVAEEVLRLAVPAGPGPQPVLEREVKREQIEVVAPPLLTYDELLSTIIRGRRVADLAAQDAGARAVALATAAMPCQPHLVPSQRYQRMRERFGLTLDEQLTCGFHVHVAVRSRDEGVAVLDRIRPWLPIFLALSANSPFWQGQDTGYASYRYQAWGRWPTAGPYDLFGSAEAYEASTQALLDCGVSLDAGMIYFDARLSAHVPTVEIRISDICLRPEDAALIAVLVRALVATAAEEWRRECPADPVAVSVLRLASWRASRFGLTGHLLHPRTGRVCRARVAVSALLEHVDGSFASGEERMVVRAGIARIFRRGTGAAEQRAAMALAADCRNVIAAALDKSHPSVDALSVKPA
jgi:carboxylate-amine ligase